MIDRPGRGGYLDGMLLELRTASRIRREEVTPEDWNDWRWQLRHRLTTLAELERVLHLTEAERAGLRTAERHFPVGITPYYAALMDPDSPHCPIRMQSIPVGAEAERAAGELRDPLGEDGLSPVPGIVHRYPDRVLLLALDRCALYCRHCNRRRMVAQDDGVISVPMIEEALAYVRRTPRIRDVLVSGGDPLTLATDRLEWIISSLRAIPHVEIIRLGTRVPVCLPQRITDELVAMLRRYHPLYINTHFNHPKELTPEARAGCERLADAGIPLGNQAVLLRGVNSSARTLRALFRELLKVRVRPYYLFQGDPVLGTDHLRTPVAAGIEIMEQLRGHISGMAIPHLVIDAPGGGGKLPIGPNYVLAWGTERLKLRNWEGKVVEYPEPAERDCSCPYEAEWFAAHPDGD
ncbi:MAG TPA: KamA family radical SAM protein [Polyangia bacterium]|jgi:lysine 2,3-aminomutase|nr:KamA family radical SAM protein [Polyangia bacterium]